METTPVALPAISLYTPAMTQDHDAENPDAPAPSPPASAPSAPTSGPAARAAAELTRLLAEPLAPGLYLVATPIGNLTDITLRALAVLSRADVIYCEDTRHSRTLTAHFGITTHLTPYHEHNASRERPKILAQLGGKRSIALISDAGTPLISDPGYKLVRDALDAGHHVESLPGASAALVALTSSGLPTDAFTFAGFLPNKSAARRTRILELAAVPSTLIFYEAPSRIPECLADLAAVLGPRPAAVARELTKRFETIQRGALDALAIAATELEPRGEYVILVGPPTSVEVSDQTIEQRLAALMADMTLRDAVKTVSAALDIPKSRVYDIGLKLRDSLPDDGQDDSADSGRPE